MVEIQRGRNGVTTSLVGTNPNSSVISLNNDGNRLLLSTAAALVAEDTNTRPDVYVWRAQTGYQLLSRTPGGNRRLISRFAAVFCFAMAAKRCAL